MNRDRWKRYDPLARTLVDINKKSKALANKIANFNAFYGYQRIDILSGFRSLSVACGVWSLLNEIKYFLQLFGYDYRQPFDSHPPISFTPNLDSFDLKENIAKVLQTLTPREEEVMRERFGLDNGQEKTLKQIAEKFGLSSERVRQIEDKQIHKMKRFFVEHKHNFNLTIT